MSPSDKRPVRFRMLQAKMNEYMANGAQLGWLIDPFNRKVYVLPSVLSQKISSHLKRD